MDIEQLTLAELAFQYGVAIEEFNRAYSRKKEFEEEFKKRYKAKQHKTIATGGRVSIPDQLKCEDLENEIPF